MLRKHFFSIPLVHILRCCSTFSAFNDPQFRHILKSIIPTGPGYYKIDKAPIISVDKLKKYINTEFDLLIENIKLALAPLVKLSGSCLFAQLLHDYVMLSNKTKYISVTFQFIDFH